MDRPNQLKEISKSSNGKASESAGEAFETLRISPSNHGSSSSGNTGRYKTRGLLFTTVRNLHYDQLRRKCIVQFSPLESAPDPSQNESYGVSLDMQTAMDQLTENERSSLFLNVVEGYTALEISDIIGIPRGTILSHLSRARVKLRKLFGSEMGVEQLASA